ncbi:MAG: hypothetical protein ABFD62_11400 [Syntrophaceae bacterium]
MHPKLRTCIAYVAGRLISGRDATSIYDKSQAKDIFIEGPVTPASVKVFDRDRGCYLSGLGDENAYELYDFGGMYYVELIVTGNTFEGYDHGTPSLFKGEMNGDDITMYDDAFSETFSFVLK